MKIKTKLEKHYKDMQDIEFTIEEGQALHAADAHRQAHRRAAVKIAVRHGEGEADHEKQALLRIPAGDLDAAAAPELRPQAAKKKISVLPRPAGLAGRGGGQVAFTADEAVERPQRREGHPGAQGDQPRGHRRHALGRGHPDQHRRHDSPRGGRRAGMGQVLRRGRRRRSTSTTKGDVQDSPSAQNFKDGRATPISIDGSTGEVMAGASRPSMPTLSGDFAKVMKLGRQVPHELGAHQRRHPRRLPAGP